jgi:hypothetical protein
MVDPGCTPNKAVNKEEIFSIGMLPMGMKIRKVVLG